VGPAGTRSADLIFITDSAQPLLYAASGITKTVTQLPALGMSPNTMGKPAVAPDGSQIWIPIPGPNAVAVLDVTSGTVVTTLTGGLLDPREVVFSPNGVSAYILNSPASGGRGSIVPVNTTGYSYEYNPNPVFATVGNKPAGLFISPAGGLLFVANSGDGTVSTVQVNGGTVTTTDVGAMPVGVVANHNPAP
jgi:YVTN family beta-propeller protein